MKILLATLNSKYVHSNLAIRYLRAYCQDLPVEMELKEFNINQHLDYIFAEVYRAKPNLVAFSCYIWNVTPTLELCSNLKKVMPELTIVLGGPEVSFDPDVILQNHPTVDFIVKGEGEVTFRELLLQLVNGESPHVIPGLILREGDQIVAGPDRPLMTNLDQIPSPFIDHLDEFENKLVYYESCRGCPFNCQYCLSSTFNGVRTFSRQRIEDDLLRLVNAGVRKVKFVDRTFNFGPDHALHIMKFLLGHHGETSFHFEITAHLLTDEILDFLEKVPAGLFQFEIGVQSTYQPTLKQIRRLDDFDRLTQVVHRLSTMKNIHLHLDLIAGLPKEDYLQFQKSFDDVFQLRPGNLQMGFLKLLKGSGIRESQERYGYKYLEQPPYEVLANDLVSFDQILELKMIEDLLETFYNSHKFESSVEFIIQRKYSDHPFGFFQELMEFWKEKDFHHRPHKDTALYQFLLEFYQEKMGPDLKIFREYLKFDFLRTIRTTVLPDWLNEVEVDDYKERVYQFVNNEEQIRKYLPHLQNLTHRQIMRRILIQPFAFDLLAYQLESFQGSVQMSPYFVLFDYDQRDPLFNRVNYMEIKF